MRSLLAFNRWINAIGIRNTAKLCAKRNGRNAWLAVLIDNNQELLVHYVTRGKDPLEAKNGRINVLIRSEQFRWAFTEYIFRESNSVAFFTSIPSERKEGYMQRPVVGTGAIMIAIFDKRFERFILSVKLFGIKSSLFRAHIHMEISEV